MDHVHSAAQRGFTDQAVAYARGRPDYPTELSIWLKGTLGLAAGTTVVDLGAGTGKFTPLLVATGAKVQAVEPVDAMRAQLARKLPEVDAHGGTAQAMPLVAGTVDAVVCGRCCACRDPSCTETRRQARLGVERARRVGGLGPCTDRDRDALRGRRAALLQGPLAQAVRGHAAVQPTGGDQVSVRARRPTGRSDRRPLHVRELHRRIAGDRPGRGACATAAPRGHAPAASGSPSLTRPVLT